MVSSMFIKGIFVKLNEVKHLSIKGKDIKKYSVSTGEGRRSRL